MQKINQTVCMIICASLIGGCALTGHLQNRSTHYTKSKDIDLTKISKVKVDSNKVSPQTDKNAIQLSKASQLIVRTCDNYLSVNPESVKLSEVLGIKASVYYNNHFYPQSRDIYTQIYNKYPNTPSAVDAVRMIAQAYYEEKKFDNAQEWYRKLRDVAGVGIDKDEVTTRIAESIFRLAESFEAQSRFKEAAEQYERVALEFPDSKISDVSLYNAGLSYEKLTEWSHAILVFQRLLQRYTESKIQPKALFRIAKSYEKLLQWDNAAETYLRVAANFPRSELASAAIYNAGFSFENAGKYPEAAATFEKMAQLFPSAEDLADVLFRAGEIYGKVKDWESVTRVNKQFTQRFGNDADRVVQALCMTGIALYMQNKETEAVDQLVKAVNTFAKMKNASSVNAYYAAKAQYTIGEINHGTMAKIELGKPRSAYKKQLEEKSNYLDMSVDAYTKAIKFNISEWTTRSIFQIGQAYEDFALGVFKQVRPTDQSIDGRLALEFGIAQAVDKYFVDKAIHYHEQNVKLGIKEKIEDKYVLQSRQKLTYLPYLAGENYLALTGIAKSADGTEKLEGFALIARKLQISQKVAPYQERAIDLFLKCLELGETYQELDDFYKKASVQITNISFNVGEAYSEIVKIARDAPIPTNFDDYERFVYKSKLLKQIEGYEDQALTNYIKTLKIAEAYKLDDESVRLSRDRIAEVLFTRGRCYDLQCVTSFSNPPFPYGISEAEKDEYRGRFEEIGLKYQEQALEIYKSVLTYAEQKYASGDFVTYSYVRLYQNAPDEYGVKEDRTMELLVSSGPKWKCSADSVSGWTSIDFADSSWQTVHRVMNSAKTSAPKGYPTEKLPVPMWFGSGAIGSDSYKPSSNVYFRQVFQIQDMPQTASLYITNKDTTTILINGHAIAIDSGSVKSDVVSWDIMSKIKGGANVIVAHVRSTSTNPTGFSPLIKMSITSKQNIARVPGSTISFSPEEVRNDIYKFPFVKNFTPEIALEAKK